MTLALRSTMQPVTRRVRAYFAPVNRTTETPTVFDPASFGLFALDTPPVPQREFRGAWVASVGNIDWPSKPGLLVNDQKAEFRAILERAVELKLNAIILQVRPQFRQISPGHWSACYLNDVH